RRQLLEDLAGENVVLPDVDARLVGEHHSRLERSRPVEGVVRLQAERMADAVEEIQERLLRRVLRDEPELQQLAADHADSRAVDLAELAARPHHWNGFALRRED